MFPLVLRLIVTTYFSHSGINVVHFSLRFSRQKFVAKFGQLVC